MKYPFLIVVLLMLFAALKMSAQNLQESEEVNPNPWHGLLQNEKSYADHSVLASGNWVRMAIHETGIQRLTYQDLMSMGFQMPIPSQHLRVFGQGGSMLPELTSIERPDDLQQVPRMVSDGGDGYIDQASDYILFYGEGPVVWSLDTNSGLYRHTVNYYNDNSSYFVNVSEINGEEVLLTSGSLLAPDTVVSSFIDYRFHELDSLNLMRTGKVWYGEVFNLVNDRSFLFDFPDLDTASSVRLTAALAARSLDTSYFTIALCGKDTSIRVVPVDLNVNTDYCKNVIITIEAPAANDQTDVEITYHQADESSVGWLNYIDVQAIRKLDFQGGQMTFRNPVYPGGGVVEYRITGAGAGARLWQISNPWTIKEIELQFSGGEAFFKSDSDTLYEYVLFDETSFFHPGYIEKVENQDLHSTGFPDMIIVTHPDFRVEADRLADFHRSVDGFEVVVTEPQLIYNEFSSGKQDPTAIRDFIRMQYVRAAGDSLLFPHYILLFGDGSYDYKDRLIPNTNFVPTYQTYNSWTPTSSFVSDDFFVLLDVGEGPNAAGLVDAGIGRLPACTPFEAKVFVDKILRYSSTVDLLPPLSSDDPGQISNFADWRNVACFIADDEDGNLHLRQAEILSGLVDSLTDKINLDKIYLDAYQQETTILGPRYPGANDALEKRMKAGALLVNYTGHGGETGLAEEGIVDMGMIENWSNFYNLPVFITASCEFSRYDNPAHKSAGEHVLLNSKGGAVAILSTTRVAFAHSNMIINTNVIKAAFDPKQSNRLGDIVRIGKVRCGLGVYMQNFTLLGDPAMRLAYPKYKVHLETLNGDSLTGGQDSIFAGNTMSLEGVVTDNDDLVLEDFNGELAITVFDKPEIVYTLANDPFSYVASFREQTTVVFQGLVSVTEGQFTTSFKLPVDISFRPGQARISLYARSANCDANGVDTTIWMVNTGQTFSGDGEGPEIKLYLNDRSFVEEGLTGSNPKLIADLYDADGINHFGAGLGHDLMMVLDGDLANPVVLNEYYRPDTDHPESGALNYALYGLADGLHKISVRAWDVLNYSSEEETSFYVSTTHDLSLNHLNVYPNPMCEKVRFCFDRNETHLKQWAQLIIKTPDGREVYSSEQSLSESQGISVCVEWDGSGTMGSVAPAGLYIYTLRLLDADGAAIQYSGKVAKVE